MIQVGFVVEGEKEIGWYGCEVSRTEKDRLVTEHGSEAEMEILEACYDQFTGISIENPDRIGESELRIWWCLPAEEDCAEVGDDHRVDLSRVKVVVRTPGRKKCLEGNVYVAGGEVRDGYLDYRTYHTGFMPPFQHEDLTLFVDHLTDFGFDGYLITEIAYCLKKPAYMENDIHPGKKLPSKVLED